MAEKEHNFYTKTVGGMGPLNRYVAEELKLPPERVKWFLVFLFSAILIGGIWQYQYSAYPHGPMILMGGYAEERCEFERNCASVWVQDYREDKSNLNNPGWVTVIRSLGPALLFTWAPIVLAIMALVNGYKLFGYYRKRKKLLVVEGQLRLLLLSSSSMNRNNFSELWSHLFDTNLLLRDWAACRDLIQQMRKNKNYTEMYEPIPQDFEYWAGQIQTKSNSEENNWPTDWEISSLERYIRDKREGITTWADDYDKDEEPDELEQAALDLIESAKYEIENYGQGGQYRTEGISISKEVEYKISSGIADLQTAIENGDKPAIEKAGDSLANALPDDYSHVWPVE